MTTHLADKRIFVTGGSGFVGKAIIDELLRRGFSVSALMRHAVPARIEKIHVVQGDLSDPDTLESVIRGCVAVIHLVGIIRENPRKGITFESVHCDGTQAVVDATIRAGVKRYVHMSALGTRADAVSRYHQTKYFAEQYVQQSGLDWTILRPSLIHGPEGEFMRQAAAWARGKASPFLFMPYFGAGLFGFGGAGLLQPIFVNDVARAFVDCISNPPSTGEIYPLGGAEVLSWPALHRAIACAILGKCRLTAPIPVWYARLLTRIVPARLLPFNADQLAMSQEDNTCEVSRFTRDFGWTPRGFTETLQTYASKL